jgi:hypothetical protein
MKGFQFVNRKNPNFNIYTRYTDLSKVPEQKLLESEFNLAIGLYSLTEKKWIDIPP